MSITISLITFWPYAYDDFWPYAYDDIYMGFVGHTPILSLLFPLPQLVPARKKLKARRVASFHGQKAQKNAAAMPTAGVTSVPRTLLSMARSQPAGRSVLEATLLSGDTSGSPIASEAGFHVASPALAEHPGPKARLDGAPPRSWH